MSDNDLIRRGDAIDAVYSDTSLRGQDVLWLESCINAIPAVSGEPVGEIHELEIGWVCYPWAHAIDNGLVKDNDFIYTTPQDQSALIAELKAQLARYEVVGEIALVKEDYASVNARLNENCPLEVGTKLFALMDEKWISCSKYLYRD